MTNKNSFRDRLGNWIDKAGDLAENIREKTNEYAGKLDDSLDKMSDKLRSGGDSDRKDGASVPYPRDYAASPLTAGEMRPRTAPQNDGRHPSGEPETAERPHVEEPSGFTNEAAYRLPGARSNAGTPGIPHPGRQPSGRQPSGTPGTDRHSAPRAGYRDADKPQR